jgi:hypothetical protein
MKNVTKKKTAKATSEMPADVKAIEQHVARTEHFDKQDAKAAKKKAAAKKASESKKATAKVRRLGEAAGVIVPAAKKTAAKTNGNGKPKAATKTATIIGMLERKGGATAPELLKATGWQAHSLRGFIAGTLKKMGRKAESTKNAKGERVYAL